MMHTKRFKQRLTPWSTSFPDKLAFPQLLKKTSIYGTQRFTNFSQEVATGPCLY